MEEKPDEVKILKKKVKGWMEEMAEKMEKLESRVKPNEDNILKKVEEWITKVLDRMEKLESRVKKLENEEEEEEEEIDEELQDIKL